MDFIPVNQPLLSGNEENYLQECIRTEWISSQGPFVKRFEEGLASRVGRKHGVAVSSGTAALEIAVKALGLGPGDEVIMPTFTIISCAAAVVKSGARPVLVDSDPQTWNMDHHQIESRITRNTKAIMVVHIYGLPCEMEHILNLVDKHGLFLIEDAAEVLGQTYNEKPCGGFGDISIFSFYPNKHITTGEGGMVLTDDGLLAEKCKDLRNLCFGHERRFVHEELGWNYRMSNLQAALGVAQLEKLDEHIKRKREIGKRYTQLLQGLEGVQLPCEAASYSENLYWVYGTVIEDDLELDSEKAISLLAERKIGTRPFFWPMHEQPVFNRMGFFLRESYPVAERLARRGLYLPSGLGIREEQQEYVAIKLKEVLGDGF